MPWVALLASADVAPGQVRAAEVGDLDLVVWRTHAGQAVVMDARCPHQWSHLEAEGVVDGDELVCTSHFWRFDASGCGTKVNVNGRRDEKGPTVTYDSREDDGRVLALLPEADPGADHGRAPDADGGGRNPDAGPRVLS